MADPKYTPEAAEFVNKLMKQATDLGRAAKVSVLGVRSSIASIHRASYQKMAGPKRLADRTLIPCLRMKAKSRDSTGTTAPHTRHFVVGFSQKPKIGRTVLPVTPARRGLKRQVELDARHLQVSPVVIGIQRKRFDSEGERKLHRGGASQDHR